MKIDIVVIVVLLQNRAQIIVLMAMSMLIVTMLLFTAKQVSLYALPEVDTIIKSFKDVNNILLFWVKLSFYVSLIDNTQIVNL